MTVAIATPNTPIPYSPPLEDAFLPGPERIAAEVARLGLDPAEIRRRNLIAADAFPLISTSAIRSNFSAIEKCGKPRDFILLGIICYVTSYNNRINLRFCNGSQFYSINRLNCTL